MFVTLSCNIHLCGNQFKLAEPRFTSVQNANFSVYQVVNIWNCSADSIVHAESMSDFDLHLNMI